MKRFCWKRGYVKAALSAMIVKMDRCGARGIARLLRMGGAGEALRTDFGKLHRALADGRPQERSAPPADDGAGRRYGAHRSLYEGVHIMLTQAVRFSTLRRRAMDVAKRRGVKRTKVALARKLALIMHRMWVDVTTFRRARELAAAA